MGPCLARRVHGTHQRGQPPSALPAATCVRSILDHDRSPPRRVSSSYTRGTVELEMTHEVCYCIVGNEETDNWRMMSVCCSQTVKLASGHTGRRCGAAAAMRSNWACADNPLSARMPMRYALLMARPVAALAYQRLRRVFSGWRLLAFAVALFAFIPISLLDTLRSKVGDLLWSLLWGWSPAVMLALVQLAGKHPALIAVLLIFGPPSLVHAIAVLHDVFLLRTWPRLRMRPPYSAERALFGMTFIGGQPQRQLIGHAWFAYADIYNDPIKRVASAEAKEVIARLAFYLPDKQTRIIAEDVNGRWATTDQAAPKQLQAQSTRDLYFANFEVSSMHHSLDLVTSLADGTVWATNNEHFGDHRYPPYQITVDAFVIHVHLTGPHVDKAWWVNVRFLMSEGLHDSPFELSCEEA